jgi:aminomethyltransferase
VATDHLSPEVVYEPFGPWIVPWHFGSMEEEYRALRTGVGLVDFSTQALLECRGADRADFLHRLLTHDIKRLAPGKGCQAALLTASAKLTAIMAVFADPDALWLLCDLPLANLIAQTFDRYLFSEQVTIVNHERRKVVLALQGPDAIACAARLSGGSISLEEPGDHAIVQFHGLSARLIRHSLTDVAGLLCITDEADGEPVWELFTQHGKADGLRVIGWEALNIARIEAGTPWFGIDMDHTNLLPETGLETALVSDTKGCYLGQEVIARMQTYGSPNKKLMALIIEGDQVVEAGDLITRPGGEAPLGSITSACRSPALKRSIAMGYLRRGAYEPGTVVAVHHGTASLQATVMARPLVEPQGMRGPGGGVGPTAHSR